MVERTLTTRVIGYRDTDNGPQLWVQFEDARPLSSGCGESPVRYYRVAHKRGVEWCTPSGGRLIPCHVPSEACARRALNRWRLFNG